MSEHGQGGRKPKWPDAALQILREMWPNHSLSASTIADTINAALIQTEAGEPLHVSRHAVIGKAGRDPLCEPREAPQEFRAKVTPKPITVAPFQHPYRDLPMHQQMRELGSKRCQWTEPKGYVCCGMPVIGPDQPWCEEHYSVVFPRTVRAMDLVKQAKIGTWGK